ncbi:GDSL esterase/lipase At5g45960-like [Andrographis paniculata]|uniref:GDSL esterase/lipase At5g45960-like n=1 Tax=Andrographis paniculata TaxID=175694 RepID=UPI0021E962FF|nr:GDSL esterase/lipase At5g45960-like [Andrographis paniculata]
MGFTAVIVLKPFFLSSPALFLLLLILFAPSRGGARRLRSVDPPPVPAILVFGDSTADSGNNNYIGTAFKGNFSPYGKDFVNQTATGRFSNGRLANDYIAKYIGIKDYVPPYLDPTLSTEELMTGVSFASAGSGFDPLTSSIGSVIPVAKQVEYLKEYRGKLEAAIGKDKTMEVMENALFLVSAGTNDFVANYFMFPLRRVGYTVPAYMDFVLSNTRQFLQGLIGEGARRIAVAGLPPIGCLPVVITLFSDHPIGNRDCLNNLSSVAVEYNQKLQNELRSLQQELHGSTRIAYLDSYSPLQDMTSGNRNEFEELRIGCCGTGLLEMGFLCNPKSPVCADAGKYVFWDSIHPTEKSYDLMVQAFRPVIDGLIRE